MGRGRPVLRRLSLAALTAFVAGGIIVGSPSKGGSAVSGCRKVVVTDAVSGQPLRGIEDIAVDAAANVAYLSADDRWAAEEATRSGGAVADGGIYLLSLEDISLGADRVEVADVTFRFKTENALHPHGIDLVFDEAGRGILYVINRRYDRPNRGGGSGGGREGGGRQPAAGVEVFDVGDGGALHHRRTVRGPAFCRANGIAGLGRERFLVSNDGAACGKWGRRWERALGLKRGTVTLVELDAATDAVSVTRIAEGIGFANGLAVDAHHLYVAATRDQALLVYPLDGVSDPGTPRTPERRIPVSGGPDNVSWASEHALLVAVHPSLLRLAAYRYRWTTLVDTAPTRIIAVDIRDGAQRTLYASDAGEPMSAATVAVAKGNLLIAGSVTDDGLMLCHLSEAGG